MNGTFKKSVALLSLFLSCLAMGFQDPPPDEPTSQPDVRPSPVVDHSELTRMLKQYVEDERIDYLAWKSEDRRALRRYLDGLASTNVSELDKNEQLAFYINLYNGTVIWEVIARYRDGFRVSEEDYAFFKREVVRLGDSRISLNHLENEIIRKKFDDPRIHVALVCAAVSCPPIRNEAYTGADLEDSLDRKMREFVSDETRNHIKRQAKLLELSSVFEWYAADFGGRAALARYVSKYTGWPVSDFVVAFLPYDWSLNIVEADSDGGDDQP